MTITCTGSGSACPAGRRSSAVEAAAWRTRCAATAASASRAAAAGRRTSRSSEPPARCGATGRARSRSAALANRHGRRRCTTATIVASRSKAWKRGGIAAGARHGRPSAVSFGRGGSLASSRLSAGDVALLARDAGLQLGDAVQVLLVVALVAPASRARRCCIPCCSSASAPLPRSQFGFEDARAHRCRGRAASSGSTRCLRRPRGAAAAGAAGRRAARRGPGRP